MKNPLLHILSVLSIIFLASCTVKQTSPHQNHATNNEILSLPKDLSLLLTLEMRAINQGMMDLVPAIASADWPKIAEIGDKIKGSYIMHNRLTKQQQKTLHHVLPLEFKVLDQKFHQLAGMLTHSAEMQKPELVNFYFYKLNEACGQCHSKYASNKFPGFLSPRTSDHTH
jgi:hypothetical protein